MNAIGHLHPLHVLNFHNKHYKELKREYLRPDPDFDAWMTVLGRYREIFNVALFKQRCPSVIKEIQEIRKVCKVNLRLIDKEEKKR